jgi:hypothetical protein
MEINKERNMTIVLNALNSLLKQVDMLDGDYNKKALRLLITKLQDYYCKKMNNIENNEYVKMFRVQSQVVDIISQINIILNNDVDIIRHVSDINDILHDSELGDYISKYKYLKNYN